MRPAKAARILFASKGITIKEYEIRIIKRGPYKDQKKRTLRDKRRI